jgi:hypothetical protein
MKKVFASLLSCLIFFSLSAQIGNYNPSVTSLTLEPGETGTARVGCFLPLPTQTTGTFRFLSFPGSPALASQVTLSATSTGNSYTTVGQSVPVYFNGNNIYYSVTMASNATYCSTQTLLLKLYRWNGFQYSFYCDHTINITCKDRSRDNLVSLNMITSVRLVAGVAFR